MSELTGRELDAAIAERCLGYVVKEFVALGVRVQYPNGWTAPRRYSKTISHAWKVAEWIAGQGFHLQMGIDRSNTNVEIWEDDEQFPSYWNIVIDVDAETAPEAICRAALALAEHLKLAEQEVGND